MLIKLRFWFPEVIFGVMLAVAIFAMGAVFRSSPNPGTPTQQSTKQAAEPSRSQESVPWWHDPMADLTLALVCIGVIQAWIFYGQMRLIRKTLVPAEAAARAAGESIELARNEFNASHRPRIRVHAVEWKRATLHTVTDGKPDIIACARASLICFNWGDSTAKTIEVRGQIFAGSNFALDVQRPLVKTLNDVVSGGKFRADILSDIPLTTLVAGKRNGIDYHCIGWVAYWDEAGVRRESGFLYRADPWHKPNEVWERVVAQEYDYEY